MKMVMIACNEAIDADVLETIESAGVEGYTKWTKVQGKGRRSGPHLMSHVWSKGNNVVLCCVEDDRAAALMDGIRRLRKELGADGIKAFVMPVTEAT